MPIDWSAHDKYSENTCYCRCESVFRSHAKAVFEPTARIVSRKPCPSCGRTDDLRKIESDSELVTL